MFTVFGDIIDKAETDGKKIGKIEGKIEEENSMADKVQKALQELINNQQISKEAAAILQSVTQQTGA